MPPPTRRGRRKTPRVTAIRDILRERGLSLAAAVWTAAVALWLLEGGSTRDLAHVVVFLLGAAVAAVSARLVTRSRATGPGGALEEGQRRSLESLVDYHPDAAMLTDANGLIVRCNAEGARFLGGTPQSLRGSALRERFTRSDLISLLEAAAADPSTNGAVMPKRRVRIQGAAGERAFDATVLTLASPAGGSAKWSLTLLRDVTELAETVRVKAEFVANASHELRTPIAALRAAVDTVRESGREDPRMIDRGLEMMSRQIGRLEELVRDLLDLSRVEDAGLAVRTEPLRLGELRESLATEFEGVCRQRRLTIDFSLDAALDGCSTDGRLLALAVRNLVENATKYAYEDSRIRVSARREQRSDGPWQRWEVRDQGVGIPLNQQQRVFERFYQVDAARSGVSMAAAGASRRGTGLGLAIVRHAVRAMGGAVGLESVYKEGTTVWLEAPIPPRPGVQDESGGDSA